jgi:uncharacterized protein YbdZ (MbtH family)
VNHAARLSVGEACQQFVARHWRDVPALAKMSHP